MLLKKLSAAVLALTLALSALPAMATEEREDGRLSLLSALGIMEGYDDGSYRLENNLTRAEFTKITVTASENRKAVSSAMAVSPFADVPYSLWSAPYIQLAAEKGYVNGYLDSTFRPDSPITYAEAVAVFLRLLGYQNSDFGALWPHGHMEIATQIGLTNGVSLDPAASISRGDTVTLLYNLLDENLKGTNTKYISVLECNSTDNIVVYATSAEDTSVPSDKVVTSAGTFKKGSRFSADWVGRTGKLFLENGDTAVAFVPKAQTMRTFSVTAKVGTDLVLDNTIYNWPDTLPVYYKSSVTTYAKSYTDAKVGCTFTLFYDADGIAEYGLLRKAAAAQADTLTVRQAAVYSVLGDGIITYADGKMEKLTLSDGVPLYKDDVASGTLQKSQLKMGDLLQIVYDADGDVDFVTLDTDGIDGPYTVQNSGWTSHFSVKPTTTIMRDGEKVSASDIEVLDILYYSEALDMILAYTDKITGVYKSASPSKDAPTMVTISDTTYSIEGIDAFHKLSGGGQFSYGDTVTVLLGRDGGIADVVTNADYSRVVGFVTATGTTNYETTLGALYTGYSITLTGCDGKTLSFEADKNYESYLNRVVSLSFSDGKAYATLSEGSLVSGKVDAQAGRIGSETVSPSVKILDTYTPSQTGSGSAMAVFLPRLDGVTLSEKQVLYVGRDSQNRISELILNDVTGDMHAYGVVTKANNSSSGMHVSGSYSYIIDGKEGTHQTSGSSFSVGSGAPAKFSYAGGRISSISRLTEMPGLIAEIGQGYIRYADGSRYNTSDADIYVKDSGSVYKKAQAEDIKEGYTLRAYYDRSPSSGGRVRVILATK